MPLGPYPPDGFECLYRHACPYLDGLSTTWVMGGYQRADEEYQQHLRIVDNFCADLSSKNDLIRILERENAELKAKLRAVHQRQFKSNRKSDEEDISCAAAPMKSKKRGAPVGHPGWFRPTPTNSAR